MTDYLFEITNQSPGAIVSLWSHSSDNIDFNNPENVCLYYDSLIKLRHDTLHFAISFSIFGKFIPEKRIDEYYPTFDHETAGKTPDILFEDKSDNIIYIIDVGYSKNYLTAYHNKKTKYKLLKITLEYHLNKKVKIIPIILDYSLNLDRAIIKIKKFFKHPFNRQLIFDCNNIYVNKMHLINSYGNAAIIQDHASKNYSDVPVKGVKNDFDCDIDFLQEIINEKYNHVPDCYDYECESLLDIIRNDLDDDGPLFNKYKDSKNNVDQYEKAYNQMEHKNLKYETKIKPTISVLYPTDSLLEKITGEDSEQKMIFNFFEYINQNQTDYSDVYYDFIKELSYQFEINKEDDNFKNGFLRSSSIKKEEEIYKDEYKKYVDNFYVLDSDGNRTYRKTKSKIISYLDFLKEKGIIEERSFTSNHVKSINFVKSNMKKQFTTGWKKSGVCFSKYGKKTFKPKTTVPLEENTKMDDFISFLKEESSSPFYQDTFKNMRDFFSYVNMSDSIFCKDLKRIAWNEIEPWYDLLSKTKCFNFSYFNHLVYSQMMHFQSLSTKPETLHFFNCGIPNFLIIMVGGYHSVNDEAGKPFMSLCLTKQPELYTEIYGNISKQHLGDGVWLINTGWSRLPIMKITFMRDSFYSTLSSSLNYSTYTTDDNDMKDRFNRFKHQFILKTIISYCTNQQIAEFLLDTRFALMSSFSTYTNIYKLLTEKFEPPYTNILSVWIVKRLFTRLKKITMSMLGENAIMWKPIEFDYIGRTKNSLGGYVNLPSLWGDYKVKNIHEILDEAFIYVHTIKEPSSMFHEQVNAIKTIIDFQRKFNETKDEYKYGNLSSSNEIINYLLDDGIIGFSQPVIFNSTNHTLHLIKPNYQNIENDVLTEDISAVVSTKAIIHTINRTIEEIPTSKQFKNKQEKKIKALVESFKDDDSENIEEKVEDMIHEIKKYKINADSKYYKTKARQKVWETVIETLEKYPHCQTVNDLSVELLKTQRAIVEADICIKSQYGAKREFYVVNIGAKLLARQVEKTYEALSKITPEEAISIPGDNKLISIQRMLDTAIQTAKNGEYKVMYVNGDCTKWSAAETMGSFIAMNKALHGKFSNKFVKLMDLTFSAWADKTINVPISIYNKVHPILDKTDYLRELIQKKSKGINSTHNFLQGMFNYASSFKSVCCSNYTYHLWQKMYPESPIKMFHMEHSDDYVMIILYKEIEEFEKFRAFYKMMMRLHGFNDSERKTSCQTLFLEFVSLMSFNGEMLYPQIKKAKEINLNLPCLGYQTDIEATMSRVGECVRVGCNLSFSYIYGKIHTYCLAEAYSLLPGMGNHFYKTFQDMFEYPIEMYGIPDQYPLFSLLCKGNINNYRLYKYGSDVTKKFINGLYALNKKIPSELDNQIETNPEFSNSFYSPRYLYDMENNQIKFIRRKLGIDPANLANYWNENKVFRFIKPKLTKYLIPWMKAMFYNRLFSEAYTAVTRTKMTLRISRYVKAKSLALSIDSEILTSEDQLKNKEFKLKLYTMKEAFNIMKTKLKEIECDDVQEEEIYQILVKCDANVSAIYSYFETANIIFGNEMFEKNRLRANKTPHKVTWFHIENNIGVIMQKLFSEDILYEEKRDFISEESLLRDANTVKKELMSKPPEEMSIMEVQFLYNQLQINKQKPITMLGYGNTINALNDFLNVFLENGVFIDHSCGITTAGVSEIVNPFTNRTFYYKDKTGTISLITQALETMTLLYSYLKITLGYETERIKETFSNMRFITNPNKYETMSYQELLLNFNTETRESMDLSITELKCAAFLQKVLLDNSDLIIDMTNSIYTYGYTYIKKGEYYSGSYHGDTECAFTYLNQKFYFLQKDNNNPILLTLTKNKHINNAAYLVALRLSNKITQREFELQKYDSSLEKYKIKKENIPEQVKIQKNIKKMSHILGSDWIRYDKIDKDLYYYPIIKTFGYIPMAQKTFNVKMKYIPKITEDYLLVSLGKMKLFTLPFWECDQYDCVLLNYDQRIDGVFLSDILSKRLIKRQLFGNVKAIDWKKVDLNHNDFLRIIKNKIPKIPFKTTVKYDNLDIYQLTDDKIKMIEKNKIEEENSRKLTVGLNYSSLNFQFETMGELYNSSEDEEDFVFNLGDYNVNSYFEKSKIDDLIQQEEELFTDPTKGEYFEYEIEDDDQTDDHFKTKYYDVTGGIDFSKIVLTQKERKVKTAKLSGYIQRLKDLEPLCFYYYRDNNYIGLKGKIILTLEMLFTTIETLTIKMKMANNDDDKNLLLFELYYLLKNYVIKEKEILITEHHFENQDQNVIVIYHYVCEKSSKNYPSLKEKYKEISVNDQKSIILLQTTIEKLIQKGYVCEQYNFPRIITSKKIAMFDIEEFL